MYKRAAMSLMAKASMAAALAFQAFAPSKVVTRKELEDVGYKAPFAKKSGEGRKRHASGQRPDADRLILDRSSSVKKMQRWLNAGSIHAPEPRTNRHLMRHGWYRRQKEKEARAAATAAWQNDPGRPVPPHGSGPASM